MKNNKAQQLGWPAAVLCFLLFFYFAVHLWLASQGKPFWFDETDGIYWNMELTVWRLFRDGAPAGQSSRSPLLYILDRLWLLAWNDQPQRYWDLRLFFRIIPVAAWSSANVYLFAHLWSYFYAEKRVRYWIASFFAFAIAQFTYTNSFGSYYAIESRGYSLWVSLSMLQFLSFWQILRSRKNGWLLFSISSVTLAFTTYASLPQTFLAGILLISDEWRKNKSFIYFTLLQKKVFFTLACSLGLGIYYYTKLKKMGFLPASMDLYWSSVMEVLLKAFHHHSYHAAFLSFPFLFVFVPLYWRKRSMDFSMCCLYSLLLVGISYVLYLSSLKNGGLFASRYVIYALPALTFLYVLGIVTIVIIVAGWLELRLQRKLIFGTFVALALFDTLGRPYSLYKGISKDISRFTARNSFSFHNTAACAQKIPYYVSDFERVNNECRGITGELPDDPGRTDK